MISIMLVSYVSYFQFLAVRLSICPSLPPFLQTTIHPSSIYWAPATVPGIVLSTSDRQCTTTKPISCPYGAYILSWGERTDMISK